MGDLMELVNECEKLSLKDLSELKGGAMEKIENLHKLGFTHIANQLTDEANKRTKLRAIADGGYVKITPAKIGAFLDRKVEAYNKGHMKPKPSHLSTASHFEHMWTNPHTGDLISIPIRPRITATEIAAEQFAAYREMSNGPVQPADEVFGYGSLQTSSRQTICRNTIHRMQSTGIGMFVWAEVRIADYSNIPPATALDALGLAMDKNIFDYFTIATMNEVKDPLLLGRLNNHEDRYFLAQWGEDVCLDDVI